MLIRRYSLDSEVDVDNTGVALVAAACEKMLKGTRKIDALWPGDISDIAPANIETAFGKAQTNFWNLKRAARALETLQISIETKMRLYEKVVTRRSHSYGLRRLPDDVLRHVMSTYELILTEEFNSVETLSTSELYDHYTARQKLRKLVFVNRQFRNVIYDLPQCFTDIGFDNLPGAACRTLSRLSRYQGAELSMCYEPESNFAHVESVCNHIVSLTILSPDDPGDQLEPLSKAEFTSLRTLRWDCGATDWEQQEVNDIVDLLSTSTLTSQLKTLVLRVHLLCFIRAFPKSSNALITSMDIGPIWITLPSDPDILHGLLCSSPALEELVLRIEFDFNDPDDAASTVNVEKVHDPKVSLHHLRKVAIYGRLDSYMDVEQSGESSKMMGRIIGWLDAPLVETLTVDSSSDKDHWSFWTYFIRKQLISSRDFPKLRTLELYSMGNEKEMDNEEAAIWMNRFLPELLSRCPSVAILRVWVPILRIYRGFDQLARLHELHLISASTPTSIHCTQFLVSLLTQDDLRLECLNLSYGKMKGGDKWQSTVLNAMLLGCLPAHLNVVFS